MLSSTVPLNSQEESRFEGLAEEAVMIDVHPHPFVLPEAMDRFIDFLRTNRYTWGFEAVKYGGWTAVTTSNAPARRRVLQSWVQQRRRPPVPLTPTPPRRPGNGALFGKSSAPSPKTDRPPVRP